MKKYYVAVGDNGGVITDDYDRALYCKSKYLRGHVFVKKVSGFEEAEDYLLDHLTEKAPYGCSVPDHYELNRVVTIRKLMESC